MYSDFHGKFIDLLTLDLDMYLRFEFGDPTSKLQNLEISKFSTYLSITSLSFSTGMSLGLKGKKENNQIC